MYLMYNMQLIEQYTDIAIGEEIENDSRVDLLYDELNECGALMDIISNYLPKSELAEFKQLLDMVGEDTYTNEFSTTASLNTISKAVDAITTGLSNGIESMIGEYIENGDFNNVEE